MQFFKRYKREIATILLLGFLQSFVFDTFLAYAKPKPLPYPSVYYVPELQGEIIESVQDVVYDSEPIVEQYEYSTSTSSKEDNQGEVYVTKELIKEENSSTLYPADIALGVIGRNDKISYDDPADNLFKVVIPDEIDLEATYLLSYEVYGATSAVEVAKSVNTTTSIGGHFNGTKKQWTRVQEYIAGQNLKKGENTVLFTADLTKNNQYLIRNLQIEKNTNRINIASIQLNGAVQDSLTGNVYLSGVVSTNQDVELFISGERIALTNHNFEYVKQGGNEKMEPLVVELKQENKIIDTQLISAYQKGIQMKELAVAFDKQAFAVQIEQEDQVYVTEDVEIGLPAGSFKESFTLSIQELRASDYAPTGMTLRNVSKGNKAYRFLPDGIKFDKEVALKIAYDPTALPSGYSAKDIQVFYFNTEIKQWTKVKVIDVLEESHQVVALTNHFTDYLAGVIEEPESPETGAFTPTTVSGIQVTNPTENTPMVTVPQINDKGDAVLSFPLMLPPARQGMVPNVSVNYNSSADEGDFGLGWSLSAPDVIEVDTRWGVPIYDQNKETESYLFNGEELLLVKSNKELYAPHKDPLLNRVTDAVFQKQKHDPSLTITRVGEQLNYTWEVQDSNTGWTSFYEAVGSKGWKLKKVIDRYGNYMEYNYVDNFGNSPDDNYVDLKQIVYNRNDTLQSNDPGSLIVQIYRKKEIDYPKKIRQDTKITTRSGAVELSPELIDKIVVRTLENEDDDDRCAMIEYKFVYKEGKFGRSLLSKIIHTSYNNTNKFSSDFGRFLCHEIYLKNLTPIVQEYTFDYHDDIGSGGLFETQGQHIMTYKDYQTDYDKFKVYISALGGGEGKSSSFGGGGSVGAVLPIFPASWLPFSRSATIGGNLSGSNSNAETKVMMFDIDGDGLPDKVFKGGDDFYYRKNLGNKFTEEVFSVKKLPNINYSKSHGNDESFSVNIAAGNYTKSTSNSSSSIYTYMADVNADGLMDVVDNERVYFGYIDPQTKMPSYSLDSSITPVIVLKEEDVAPVLNPMPQMDLVNGPMDIVMVWRAPKPGQVKVSGVITKEHIALQSGVKFSIEKLHETDRGPASFIEGPNLMLSSSATHTTTLSVVKGDLLFFRTHTNQIPTQELGVSWNPKVEYVGENTDPNITSSRHESTYKEGFIVGTSYEQVFKKSGKYRLEWPSFSVYDQDQITIRVSYFKKASNASSGGNIPVTGNNMLIYNKTSRIEENFTFASPNIVLDMNSIYSNPTSFHYMKVEVLSDTEIDWKKIDNQFKPKLVSLDNKNEDLYLIPYYSNYSKVHTSNVPLKYTATGPRVTVTINNDFKLNKCTEAVCKDRYVYLVARWGSGNIIGLVNTSTNDPMGYVKFRFKFNANGDIIQKQRLNENEQYINLGSTYSFTLTPVVGSKYFFEYYTTEHKIGELLDAYQQYQGSTPPPHLIKVTASGASPHTYMAGVDSSGKVKANVYTAEQTTAWGPMFRNWGQFAYKGADIGGTYEPIVGKHVLPYDSNQTASTGQSVDDILKDPNLSLDDISDNIDDIEDLGGNISVNFGMLLPNKQNGRWESHEHLYAAETTKSPYIRFLSDDIPDLRPPTVPVHNFGAAGITKYTSFTNRSENKSVGFLMVNLGRTNTKGSSELFNDFMDINGDGFPDIIGKRIQLTAKRGGLSNRIIQADFNTKTKIKGAGNLVGGSNVGIFGSPPLGSGKNTDLNLKVGNQGSASISGSKFTTENSTNRFYVDINGDGLVDIVQDGEVYLNYGGVFHKSTIWSGLPNQQTETVTSSGGGGLGFSAISNMDVSAGLSISESASKDVVTYLDLNGDGLPEKIIDGTSYYINLGTRFETIKRTLPGRQIQKSIDAGFNGNGTICVYFPVPIIFIGPKFCVSLGGSYGKNISSEEARYMDFDGDGFIDYVTSTKNESITVYKSRIKRTNLLKKVTQATGATITLDYNVVNPIDKSTIGSTYKMPYKKWALTKVAVFDGFVGDGENVTSYAYEYFNGYKDRKERSFFGFGMTKSHLLDKNGWPYLTTVTEYLLHDMTDNELYRPGISSDLKQYIYKKGLPKKTYTLNREKKLLNETAYSYKFYDSSKITGDINTSITFPTEVSVYTEKLSVLPLITSIKNKVVHYDSDDTNRSAILETESKFSIYDKQGNVKKYLDVTRGLTVDIEYSLGRKNLPISHKISTTATNQMLRLTQASSLDGVQINEVKKYHSNNQFAAWNYEYDAVGNLTKKIFPIQNGTRFYYEYEYAHYTNQNNYSGELNHRKVFPSVIKDAFGNQMVMKSNAFGQPMKIIDVYGEESLYKYDQLNRLIEYKGPYHTDWTIRNEYKSNRKSITKHNLGQGNILHTSMFTDGLGRVIQTKKEMLPIEPIVACGGLQASYQFAVSGDVIYDEFGRAIENFLTEEEVVCSFAGGTLDFWLTNYYAGPQTPEKRINRIYDNQNRVTQELVYGTNALTTTKFGFGTDDRGRKVATQEVTLPEGNKTVSLVDELGQVIELTHLGTNEALHTSFYYDSLGQLGEVRNALGDKIHYQYDKLGRMVFKVSPASGPTSFSYDDLGNLVHKEDADGVVIDYDYSFNRLMNIHHPSIATTFTYDQGGRLQKMEDLSGTHEFTYGKLGEVVEENKMLFDQFGESRYFRTKYKYDSWGRILEMIYPDRERVFYNYNRVGQLIEIVNEDNIYYLKDVKYNYLDQPYYIKYGNDVEMTQEFDVNERLRAAQLNTPDRLNPAVSNVFSRNVYNYDKNNNIISTHNQFSQHDQVMVGGTSSKIYTYDAFNRLEFAQGRWEGLYEQHDYDLRMSYNRDHSIAEKEQKHVIFDRSNGQTRHSANSIARKYDYDNQTRRIKGIGEEHHAFGSIGREFAYSATGNLIQNTLSTHIPGSYEKRDIQWDANNNIVLIVDNPQSIINEYVYDGKGERVVKRLRGGNAVSINGSNPQHGMYGRDEILYPSGNLVYNEDIYTKHYYVNGKRIASRIDNSSNVNHFLDPYFNHDPSHLYAFGARALLSTNEIQPISLSKTSPILCKEQVEVLLNVLYNAEEMADCKNKILAILARAVKLYTNPMGFSGFITDYCFALEEINKLLCVQKTSDGYIIDPTTGYIYDPVTGIPYDPVTREPIDLGVYKPYDRTELDCYNKYIAFINYYKYKPISERPSIYDNLIKYSLCLEQFTEECLQLYGVVWNGIDNQFSINFCSLDIPDVPREEEEDPIVIPDFSEIILAPGVDDTWVDQPPVPSIMQVVPMGSGEPIWWYHSDHLGSTSYITDFFGIPVQYIEYLPFGEVMVEQSTNSILENVYKFNAKELDESTGYYYYGARYYDPGTSVFLSVDPLADKMPRWNPYTYTFNNPINLTDPTGMLPEKGDGHYFGSDGTTYLGTDGKNDNKAYTLKGGLKPNLNNKSVNWGGKLDVKHAEKLRSNSTESVFDTSKVDNAPTSTIKRTGNGGFDPSRVDGAVINALKYDLPQGLQDTGDATALVGYGMTITGVGAGIGASIAGIGGAMSGVGAGMEAIVNIVDNNYAEAGQSGAFIISGEILNAGLNRAIPGPKNDLGKQILKQGASLKLKIIENEVKKSN